MRDEHQQHAPDVDRTFDLWVELSPVRFANEPELLAGWLSISNVFGPPRPGGVEPTPVERTDGGEVKPAA